MSPALLSKRLKDLEAAGIVARSQLAGDPALYEYTLTSAGKDLGQVVFAIGDISTKPLPLRRSTIQVIFSDLQEARRNWWLIIEPGAEVDLCSVDPGFDVDLYLVTDLRTMTEIWMGYTTIAHTKSAGTLVVTGNRQLEADLQTWLGLSPFAKFEKLVA
jgi:hypothetical protein